MAAVATAEPVLSADVIAGCVAAAVPTRWYMTSLANALAADPDCLTSGGSTAPVVVDRLVGALVAAGAVSVRPPVCADCRGTKWLNQNFGGVRVCQPCAGWRRAEPCHRCAKVAPVSVRNGDGLATCRRCRMTDPELAERCSQCGDVASVASRTGNGPLCRRCYRRPIATCEGCGRMRECTGTTMGRPRCSGCVDRRRDICAWCAKEAKVSAAWAGRPACPTCYERVLVSKGVCDGCGERRRIDPRNSDGRVLCSTCAGLEPMHVCGQCGDEDKLYETDRCRRCVLRRRVDTLLSDRDGVIRPELVAVADCLAGVEPVKAGLKWVLRPHNQAILAALASGELALSHEALDGVEAGRTVGYFRPILVSAGALPARDETLAQLELWIAGVVADIADPVDRHLVETFAVWRLLRRVRQRADKRETRDVGTQQGWIRRAIEFLAFLRAHDTSLAVCTQAHVDLWLAGPPARRQVREFLRWAVRHRVASNIEIVGRRAALPVRPLDADRYPALVGRLLVDTDISIGDRVAGLLVLLYAQSAADIARLTVEHVERRDDGVLLRLGDDPCVMPEPIAGLLVALVDGNRRGHAAIGVPTERRWLYPGSRAGCHLTGARLQVRLNVVGIRVRDARTVALLNLAVDVPVGVLADMLGIGSRTASRWSYNAGGGWADYAAQRLSC